MIEVPISLISRARSFHLVAPRRPPTAKAGRTDLRSLPPRSLQWPRVETGGPRAWAKYARERDESLFPSQWGGV